MYLQFVGDPGEFLTGVPARDLTKQEIDALSDETRSLIATHMANAPHPLYRKHEGEAEEPKSASRPAEPEPLSIPSNVGLVEAAPPIVEDLDLKPDKRKSASDHKKEG